MQNVFETTTNIQLKVLLQFNLKRLPLFIRTIQTELKTM